MKRRAVTAAAIAAWWIVVALLFCGIAPFMPLVPPKPLRFDGAGFEEKFGRAERRDSTLAIGAAGAEDGASLQARAFDGVDASAWRILRYRFSGLPRTLELALIFRRDGEEDVQTVALPWPSGGSGAIDLARVPEWRGRIVEVGFSEFPTAQIVPPELGFKPFALEAVSLEPPSWRGMLAVRRSDWFGYRPWALMSISALGPDSPAPRGPPLVLGVALGAFGTIVLGVWLLGWRRRKLAVATFVVAAVTWLALDLRWLASLHARHAGTREIYAGKPWREREGLVADSAVHAAASRVRDVLANEPRGTRIIVDAASDYERARLIYHLQPLNTGPANITGYGTAAQRSGALAVLYRLDTDLDYDRRRGALIDRTGQPLDAQPVLEDGDLRIYRFATVMP